MDILAPYQVYILSFISAVVLSLVFIPQIIKVSEKKMLFDMPDNERKFHTNIVPQLGGTGIFFAYIIPTCMLMQPGNFGNWNNIIAAFLMLFITGLIDDLRSLNATKKFAAQFLPAIITVYIADVRISSLHGFMGIGELPYWISIGFSIIGCIFITNAYNFIDGVDGLAGSIGFIGSFAAGIFLASLNNIVGASLAFSLAGALAGFLKFNLPPAKIFMGDTGSLPIGYTIAVLCIVMVNSTGDLELTGTLIHSKQAALIIGMGVLFIVALDSFRVFAARLIKGVSPFRGDRNHVHHYLLDAGFSQAKTVSILATANVAVILIAYSLQDVNINITAGILFLLCVIAFIIVYQKRKQKLRTGK
jgi:UDP-N-acetylmuramyl pentapeptide phosphotransferase/UDP-N-acetylglucosamine-1-phosphate transferase